MLRELQVALHSSCLNQLWRDLFLAQIHIFTASDRQDKLSFVVALEWDLLGQRGRITTATFDSLHVNMGM